MWRDAGLKNSITEHFTANENGKGQSGAQPFALGDGCAREVLVMHHVAKGYRLFVGPYAARQPFAAREGAGAVKLLELWRVEERRAPYL
jgi:hypothetical protein